VIIKSKKKNKRYFYTKITKWRLIAFFLLSGYVQFPFYVSYTLSNPIRAAELSGKITLGMFNVWIDARRTATATYEKLVPQPIRSKAKRYQVASHANFIAEGTGMKDVPWYHKIFQKLAFWR